MNELVEFLTSQEIVVVYIAAAIACGLCIIVYFIDKNYYKRKRKQNTKELNQIVEEIQEQEVEEVQNDALSVDEAVSPVAYDVPVLEKKQEEIPLLETISTPSEIEIKEEPEVEALEDLETKQEDEKEALVYTDIEPNPTEAQEALAKLTQELEQAQTENNIDLTAYEEEQEENAIISLEELLQKSKELAEKNEMREMHDELTAPISLSDLEKQMKEEKVADTFYEEPVLIENITEELEKKTTESVKEQMVLDDFYTIKSEPLPPYSEEKKFKRSPVISPIYGIEARAPSTEDIELENTANYEKLDEEIKKTNEFLMTLRELQKKLNS